MNQRILACAAAVLLAFGIGGVSVSQAQNSPVGTWDFVLSGRQQGVAQITFSNNFTLSGIEIIAAKKSSSSSGSESGDERGGVNPEDRTAGGGGTNTATVTTNVSFYGQAFLSGNWTYDSRGRVIGVLTEGDGAITNGTTNGISFKASVKPGVRISMTGTRDGKTISYRGVPLVALSDQSGEYYGAGKRAGNSFTELFTLAPAGTVLLVNNPLAGLDNAYDVFGVGPAYNFVGQVMVSSQKRMAYYTLSDITTNGVLRSVAGSYNPTKGVGSLVGVVENGASEDSVRLKVTRQ